MSGRVAVAGGKRRGGGYPSNRVELRWKIPPSRSLGQKARQRSWSELIGVGRELVGVAAELVGVGRGWSRVGWSWLVLRLLGR